MVFVDISGFTKMSERLARQGRVGAEELTEVIGDHLRRPAPGGLCLRCQPPQVRRATPSCSSSHKTAINFGPVPPPSRCSEQWARSGVCETSAGTVTLRMSVGIHSGEFDFFLVGDSHRELIVAGPAASRTVEMESAASAGPDPAQPRDGFGAPQVESGAAEGSRNPPQGRRRSGAVRVSGGHVPYRQTLAQFVPIGLCDLLLGGEVEPEHRPATVAFLHFHGFDTLIETEGCDVAARSARRFGALGPEMQSTSAGSPSSAPTSPPTGERSSSPQVSPPRPETTRSRCSWQSARSCQDGPALPVSVGSQLGAGVLR